MTVIDALKSVTNYPIPTATLNRIAVARDLEPTSEMNAARFKESKYRLAEADTMIWISNAPSFSEGGVSISYSERDKVAMRSTAQMTYNEFGESNGTVAFGYIGTAL